MNNTIKQKVKFCTLASILVLSVLSTSKASRTTPESHMGMMNIFSTAFTKLHEKDDLGDFIEKNINEQETKTHVIKKGDNYWKIANTYSPENVPVQDYIKVLKSKNGVNLQVGQVVELPSSTDLAHVTLPDIELQFEINDPMLVQDIMHSEGSFEGQKRIKRTLINGTYGAPVQNNKFYPYRDSRGHWTIGYGRYLSAKEAKKYSNGITKQHAEQMLITDMEKVRDDFVLLLKQRRMTNLPPSVQKGLYELTYNMGSGKLNKFNNMWVALEKNDYNAAAKELKNSAWSKQVQKERVERIINLFDIEES